MTELSAFWDVCFHGTCWSSASYFWIGCAKRVRISKTPWRTSEGTYKIWIHSSLIWKIEPILSNTQLNAEVRPPSITGFFNVKRGLLIQFLDSATTCHCASSVMCLFFNSRASLEKVEKIFLKTWTSLDIFFSNPWECFIFLWQSFPQLNIVEWLLLKAS